MLGIYEFNFKKYPELLELFKKHEKLSSNVIKFSMKNSDGAGDKLLKALEEKNIFARTIFAKAIYEAFNSQKPLLHNMDDDTYEKWDKHFGGVDFESLNNDLRDDLVGLIERNFIYELPSKYYK